MKPVRPGDRGPAVEDIQRRLLVLGHDLGRTGIDGVFLGRTREAVEAFQREHGLAENGVVGEATWAALVDATFTLGDRMLYLRLPHFHGRDVRSMQEALNALGFACGQTDSIFGTFTERAVREFQRNAGLAADGIVGRETVSALTNLRHVWEGKEPLAHSAAQAAPARACEALTRHEIVFVVHDHVSAEVAGRVVNLALANAAGARVTVWDADEGDATGDLVVRLVADGTVPAVPGVPYVLMNAEQRDFPRLVAAVSAARSGCGEMVVELDRAAVADERGEQQIAVAILDALCTALD
jgi:peptidoglycan hydrolase-like protein with peptidoglycan-binding domain